MRTKKLFSTTHYAGWGGTMLIGETLRGSLLFVFVLLFVGKSIGRTTSPCDYSSGSASSRMASISSKRAELLFIENKGQITDQGHKSRSDIDFRMGAANGLNIFVGSGAIRYQFSKTENPAHKTSRTYEMYRMDVELVGANKHATIVKEQQQNYYENHRLAGDATAHAYTRITYKDVYPYIDWVLYVANGQLKHEFVVKQGGRVADIQLKYGGVTDLKINACGSLIASTPQGAITENAPCTYQRDGKTVASSYRLDGDVLSYEIGSYEGDLIIDPTLAWATYYGGTDPDEGNSIATDNNGNVYMTGRTYSLASIATSGAHQTVFGGYADAFVVKFNSAGVRQWATYYGGSEFDEGFGIAVDGQGNVYMTGEAWSVSGIATPGAFQFTYGGNGNAFLVKFNSAGVRQWGTYFGITGASGAGVAVDDHGNVYMTGNVTTSGVATAGAHQTAFGGLWDAFLVKFSSSGVRKWATYYGGTAPDFGKSVATDRSGNVYVGGLTASVAGIATHSAFKPTHGGGTYDMFLVQFTSAGVRKWGTYYGGSGDDQGHAVATDGSGNVYITGMTTSPGLATSGGHETTYKGSGYNAILVKFDENGWRKWATYYGGNGGSGNGVATDGAGNVYLTGDTYDSTGVATPGAYQTVWAGGFDAFLVRFTSWGERKWATYYGGVNDDMGHGVATDQAGNVYITGITNSSGLATPGAYQVARGGNSDAFLAKFGELCSIAGKPAVCVGCATTLTNGAAGGTWSCSSPWVAAVGACTGVVTGISAGTARITYTMGGMCVTTVVTVHPLPVVTAKDANVCAGGTVSLCGSPYGGTWTGIGVCGSTFSAGVLCPGIYTVTYHYTNSNGCAATATARITVKRCCDDDHGKGRRIATTAGGTNSGEYGVYPNPNTGAFTVEIPAAAADATVTVMDLNGRVVATRNMPASNESQKVLFNLDGLSKGIHFVQVVCGENRYMTKILVQ